LPFLRELTVDPPPANALVWLSVPGSASKSSIDDICGACPPTAASCCSYRAENCAGPNISVAWPCVWEGWEKREGKEEGDEERKEKQEEREFSSEI